MTENTEYSLILLNSASKDVEILRNLHNISSNGLLLTFSVTMPERCQAGEYRYFLIPHDVVSAANICTDDALLHLANGAVLPLSKTNCENGILKYMCSGEKKNFYDNNIDKGYYE